MPVDLILGTAGHVDHGKTSLIRALTGIDTDRLPEEKRRGITIDLGFAHLKLGDFRLGIVDVPGHERLVRNMLAGATGMDLVMLLVAADEGVKPQTREHLEIVRLLNLQGGVIVLTKADLATPDWIELVEAEVRQLVAGTILANAPLVRTSTITGQGLDELRAELTRVSAGITRDPAAELTKPFRLAIDRSFSVAGHGTVVTGSVTSGVARVGDELSIEPGNLTVRVRGLHHHDQPVDEVLRGQRAAINLAGIHHEAVHRGQELATPGHLVPSKLLTAQVALLADAPRLRSRTRVRVHLGTAEVLGTMVLVDSVLLQPGESAPVQFFLAEPVVATWNQPLVIRSESPVRTIGGGRVLDPNAIRLRRPSAAMLAQLELLRGGSELDRGAASLYFNGWRGWQPADLPRLAGVAAAEAVVAALVERGDLCEIRVSPTRMLRVHRQSMEVVAEQVSACLNKLHDQQPLQLAFPRSAIAASFAWLGEPAVLDAVLDHLRALSRIQVTPSGIALVGRGPKLSRGEQALFGELVGWFRTAGIASPGMAECQQRAAKSRAAVPQLFELAAQAGNLIQIAPDYWLHAEVEQQARQAIATADAPGRGLTVSEIREVLKTTRKYAVPLCEYWDRVGFTTRSGDLRRVRDRPSREVSLKDASG